MFSEQGLISQSLFTLYFHELWNSPTIRFAVLLLNSFSWPVSLLSVIRLITVVSSANLTMTLELCVAVQSCVYREYMSGLRTQPCGAPMLRTRGDEGIVAHTDHLTSACQEVQDAAAQRSIFHREQFFSHTSNSVFHNFAWLQSSFTHSCDPGLKKKAVTNTVYRSKLVIFL